MSNTFADNLIKAITSSVDCLSAMQASIESLDERVKKLETNVAPKVAPISKAIKVDFTSPLLVSSTFSPGSLKVLQPNLLECGIGGNESYYGLTERISYDREIFVKMDMWFGEGFDFGQGMKIFRLRGYNESAGLNYFDFIVQITSAGSPMSQGGMNESHQITVSRNSGATWGVFNKTFTRNQSYSIQYRFLLNSAPGKADGVFQMWLDDVMIFNITDLEMTKGAVWNPKFNRVLWGGWYSNGAGGNPNAAPMPGPIKYQIFDASHSSEFIT